MFFITILIFIFSLNQINFSFTSFPERDDITQASKVKESQKGTRILYSVESPFTFLPDYFNLRKRSPIKAVEALMIVKKTHLLRFTPPKLLFHHMQISQSNVFRLSH